MLLGSKPVISRRKQNSPGRPRHVLSGHLWSLQISSSVGHQSTGQGVQASPGPACSSEEHRPGSGTGSGKRIEWPSPTLSTEYGPLEEGVNLPPDEASTRKVWERKEPATWTQSVWVAEEGLEPGEPAAVVPAPPLWWEGYESVLFLGTVETAVLSGEHVSAVGSRGEPSEDEHPRSR